MNYLRLDNKKRKANNVDIARGIVLVLILFIFFYLFRNPLINGLHAIQGSITGIFGNSNPVVRAEADKALIESLKADNEQLKGLLGRKFDETPSVIASVISRPPQTPYDSIIVDAGINQSVRVGDVVYGGVDYAIGKVSAVYARSSLVTLFSSSGQKADVVVGTTSSSSMAVVEGRGGGNFYIKLPKNVEALVGAPILWPDSGVILLGSVEKVDSDSGGTYSYLYFKSPVNMQILRYVEIKKTDN